jgi:hypothetical protein
VNHVTHQRQRISLVVGLAVLGTALAAAAGIALWRCDATASCRRAIAFSAVVSGGGALAAWAVSRWPSRHPGKAVATSLAAVALRIFVPLAALAWLRTGGRDIHAAGGDRLLLGFYLTLLATDILLNIMEAAGSARRHGREAEN